jgi:predicted transcriptional regulator
MSRLVEAPRAGSGPSYGRSPLGLGPLETAIMQALWDDGGWVNLPVLRDSMNYHRHVAYTTTATVIGILCDKGLVYRELGDRPKRAGAEVWWYRAARPQAEHIGNLIATLLNYSASPAETLAHALARMKTAISLDGSVHNCLSALGSSDVATSQALSAEKAPVCAAPPPGNGAGRLQSLSGNGNGGEA